MITETIISLDQIARMAHVPEGLCRCGCGQPTPINTRNDRKAGLVKGTPRKTIRGHQNRKNPYQYFLDNIEVDIVTGCWNWTGDWFTVHNRPRWGLGHTTNDKEVTAYRAVYRLFVGEIADGLFVCHSCDTPLCVNPSHLWLGTAQENLEDASRKGRLRTAADNRADQPQNLKLDEDKVWFILHSPESGKALANYFGVSPSLIYLVRKGEVWKDVYKEMYGPDHYESS